MESLLDIIQEDGELTPGQEGFMNKWIPRLAEADKMWANPYPWQRVSGTTPGIRPEQAYARNVGLFGFNALGNNDLGMGIYKNIPWIEKDAKDKYFRPYDNPGYPTGSWYGPGDDPVSWDKIWNPGFRPFTPEGISSYGQMKGRYFSPVKSAYESGITNQYPHYSSVPYFQQPPRYQPPVGFAHGGMLESPIFDSAEKMQSKNGDNGDPVMTMVNKLIDAILSPGKDSDEIINSFKSTYGEEEFEAFRQALMASHGLGGEPTEVVQYDNGRMVNGPGTGTSDSIPATIEGREPVMLSDGEYVVPRNIVDRLGNGSPDAGGKVLDQMLGRVDRG
jgi:hypothetical protein